MEEFKLKIPTDAEISEAQNKLGFVFSPDYVAFIKSGYDLGDAPMEALEVFEPPSYANIFETLESARKYYGLPKELLPICEDNSDYYCLNSDGEVIYWSHNGKTDEKWENVTEWRKQMILEAEG